MSENNLDDRLSGQMFQNEAPEPENKEKNKNCIFIIMIILFLSILAILIVLLIIFKNEDKDKGKDKDYNPIPSDEDLDFSEEEHRAFSRKVATETMVLATNNGELPIKSNDLVVLFGNGTINTIYGGWGSGEVYNKGTSENMIPVTILEGIENKTDKCKYKKNEIGYEIGIPGLQDNKNLTDEDIELLSQKVEGEDRSIAILTISRRSGEGSDRPQDSSSSGTLLTDSEIATYNSLKNHFNPIPVTLRFFYK